MKQLFIATACAFCATAAVADDVTVSVANGTDRAFDSITVYAMDAGGAVAEAVLGNMADALKPGRTARIKLALPECQPVFVQAIWASGGSATTAADACDPAVFTLSE